MESIAWASGGACSVAATSLFGRSLGENDPEKGKAYLRFILKWALLLALAESVIFVAFGRPLATLFTNDQSLYPIVVKIMLIAAAMLPLIGTQPSISGALRSAGDSIAPLIASLVSLWVFQVGLGYVVVSVLGLGIYVYRWCIVANQLVRLAVVAIFYLTGHWKKKLK
jgi:Na+-driven multidrug efflux pump